MKTPVVRRASKGVQREAQVSGKFETESSKRCTENTNEVNIKRADYPRPTKNLKLSWKVQNNKSEHYDVSAVSRLNLRR